MLELKNVSQDLQPRHGERQDARSLASTSRLNDGDFVTVIGGNGAGKSTMLNAIAGACLSRFRQHHDRRAQDITKHA